MRSPAPDTRTPRSASPALNDAAVWPTDADVEPHHVRLDRLDGDAEGGEPGAERRGAGVVVGQALDVVGEGVPARRRRRCRPGAWLRRGGASTSTPPR